MRACLLSCFVVSSCLLRLSFFFFFNDTATTEIYTLSLHDALPICPAEPVLRRVLAAAGAPTQVGDVVLLRHLARSEEHTSELQSRLHLVCRLLLEKKKKTNRHFHDT